MTPDPSSLVPTWNAFLEQCYDRGRELIVGGVPYTISMEKRVPNMVPGRWPWSKPRRAGYVDVVSTPIPGKLVASTADQYDIVPAKDGDHWTWDGFGEFRAFLVHDAGGRLFLRGGHLSSCPVPGSSIVPKITTIIPIKAEVS